MKELSIEEKAKLYDKAIAYTKKLLKTIGNATLGNLVLKNEFENIFPELKEDEDERIRKELIEYIRKTTCVNFIGKCSKKEGEKFISWLEKQGEKGTNGNNREIPFSEQNLTEKTDVLMSLDEAIEHCKEKSCGNNACALEHKQLEKWLTELKELKEQKSTLPKWKYKNDNTPLLRDSLILNKYGCVGKSPSGAIVSDVWIIDYDELAKLSKEEYDKQGEQKPTQEIEPFLLEELKERVEPHNAYYNNDRIDIEVWVTKNKQWILKLNGKVVRGQWGDEPQCIYKQFFYLNELISTD